MDKSTIKQVVSGVFEELFSPDDSGPYAGVLPKYYGGKRKYPNAIGRMQLQWCAVPRAQLTEDEIHHFVRQCLRDGSVRRFNEAYGLIEERGLIPESVADSCVYAEVLERLGLS